MQRTILFFLILITAFTQPVLAGDKWAPIPDEVWAMKDDAAKVAKGAVFLEVNLILDNRMYEQSYRLRILSEAGKAAAQFQPLHERAFDIEGRTVTRDGKVVTFNSRKDFQTKSVVETRWSKVQSTLIVPPGVTDDCVVEFRYKVPYNFMEQTGWGSLGKMSTWWLAEAYPVKTYTVEVDKLFAWAWSFQGAPGVGVTKGERSGGTTVTLHNVPEVKPLPYSLASARPVSRLTAFPNPPGLAMAASQGTEFYWKVLGNDFWKPYFTRDIDRGRAYRALSEQLRAGISSEPQKAAAEILLRLGTTVRNVSHRTTEERIAFPNDPAPSDINSRDLDVAAKRKLTDDTGFQHLYFELLKDAGIPTLVGLVADKDVRIVNPRQPNFQQFTHIIFGIEEAGKPTAWMDPTLRFAEPGLIHEGYQGTVALTYDSNNWAPKFTNVTVHPREVNRREFEYRLTITPEEEQITLNASFHGAYALRERESFMEIDPQAQAKALRDHFEELSKDLVIQKALVADLMDPKKAPRWQAVATIERELGRRAEVQPFPLMPWPLYIPDQFDLIRFEPISLPFLSTHKATTRFKIPAGYKFLPGDPIKQENDFGRVEWRAEMTPDGEALVAMECTVETTSARTSDYRAFKIYLGWIQEACQRQIVLEKE